LKFLDDLSSEIDDDDKETEKDVDSSPASKEFSLRIPRVNLPDEENKRLNSSSSSNDESKQEKPKLKKKKKGKKQTMDTNNKSLEKQDEQTIDDTKKSSQKKDKAQARIEHFKKLLRISGIRPFMKKTELDKLTSNKAKIDYLKSFFDTAGFTG